MKIRIKGIEGYDGEYDCDLTDFSQRELADMETFSGVPFAKFEEGYISVVVALAAAVLKRAGKPIVEDMLWNAKPGAISWAEDDAVPPEQSPAPSKPGEQNNSESSDTETTSESLDSSPSDSGGPGSETSSPSDRLTLAS